MTNYEMTIDELAELASNPQKLQDYLQPKRNKALNRRIKKMLLDITESLRNQYNERLDGRYVYVNTFSSIRIDDLDIAWLVTFSCNPSLEKLLKERLSPLDVARMEKADKIRKKIREEIDKDYPLEKDFAFKISNFFRWFYVDCMRNGEYERWEEVFDVVYEEVHGNSLLVRIKREYRHEYKLILNTIDKEARNHTWFS